MEYEIRFYYPKKEKNNIVKKIQNIPELKYKGRFYEKTTQYNSTLDGNNFYSKEIDGRYRVRITKGEKESTCMLSWKRRLPDSIKEKINKEEEIECRINVEDYENFIYLTENIVKLERVESYERYRSNYSNSDVEISLDEYPFGLALEIEAKTNNNQQDIIDKYIKKLNLNYEDSFRLSWDDKYEELCNEQGIVRTSDILFECDNMPEIK